jgi:hypothetical protein
MCIRPLDPRYADPRLPLYSLHLSSTDSWVAHTLYALSEIAYRDFAISDVLSSCQYKNPIPEIPCSKQINDPDYILDSTVMIESRNRTSRFRVSRCQEILTLKSVDSRSPILHAEIQWSRLLLARRLRLHRDFSSREIGTPEVK